MVVHTNKGFCSLTTTGKVCHWGQPKINRKAYGKKNKTIIQIIGHSQGYSMIDSNNEIHYYGLVTNQERYEVELKLCLSSSLQKIYENIPLTVETLIINFLF